MLRDGLAQATVSGMEESDTTIKSESGESAGAVHEATPQKRRRRRWRSLRAVVVLALFLAILGGGLGWMTWMPGASYTGELEPLSASEAASSVRLRAHVGYLAGTLGPRNVYAEAHLSAAARYVEEQLAGAGCAVSRQEYTVWNRVTVANVVGEVRGGDLAEEIVVVGSHYDTVADCPGANDNGTGVAAVIETARLLQGRELRRTVRFVGFVNEEPPFFQTDDMGSLVYARACKARGDRIIAMFTPETIGCYSDAPGSQEYPLPLLEAIYPSAGNFIAFVGNPSSSALLRRTMALFRARAKFPSQGLSAPGALPGVGWSDHWAFWQEGYPAVMMTDTAPFRYAHYHRPTDTPEKCDYDRMARVVHPFAEVVAALADAE